MNKVFLQNIDSYNLKESTIIVKRLMFDGDVRVNDRSALETKCLEF